MDEVLGNLRQVVVDDVRDVLHVNAARGHVGSYQHLEASGVESAERAGSLRLGAIAVNHRRGEAVANQALGQTFRTALGAREDQGLSLVSAYRS